MRLFATAIALCLLAAPASAQVRGDLRNNVGVATEAMQPNATVSETNVTPHMLDGRWTRVSPNGGAVFTMQTGEDGALSGSFGDDPCLGAYHEDRFTLFCDTGRRVSYLITGQAQAVQPELSAGFAARVVGQPARIEGHLTYVSVGLRPDANPGSEFFNAERN